MKQHHILHTMISRGFTPHFTNCYACGARQTGAGLGSFTESEMTDGTLLSLLWQGIFRQEPGTDTHPLLSHPTSKNPLTPTGIQAASQGGKAAESWFDLGGRPVAGFWRQRGIIVRNGRKLLIGK